MNNKSQLIELCCKDEEGETDWPQFQGESIGGNCYIIKDIYWDLTSCVNPLNISFNDIIEAHPNEDGDISITQIIEKSGYTSLYLMATAQSTVLYENIYGEDAIKFSNFLETNDCTWIVSMASFWLVHIPPSFDFQSVLSYIQSEEIPLQHHVNI
jgi:hypothetical protein